MQTVVFQTFSKKTKFPEVLLYGAGNVGRQLAKCLIKHGVRVRFFMDKGAGAGQVLAGVPVVTPAHPCVDNEARQLPVIISIFNREVDIRRVGSDLMDQGFTTVMHYLDVHSQYREELGEHFWLPGHDPYPEQRESVRAGLELMADQQSKCLYEDIIAYRAGHDFNREPIPDPTTQYIPGDVPGWIPQRPVRLIDCGAYIGDTIALMERTGIVLDFVAAFEPDQENFRLLSEYVRSNRNLFSNGAAIWPCGVSQQNEMLSFDSGNGDASKVTDSGGQMIQCVRLDDVAFGMRASMIKMDIEGSELSALKGAEALIRTFRPRLAIGTYHVAEHHWAIALLIAGWNLNYRFYLRSHAYQTFETVLYAVPS